MEYLKFRFDQEILAERFISKSVLGASRIPFVSSINIVNYDENCVMVEVAHTDISSYVLGLAYEHQGQLV